MEILKGLSRVFLKDGGGGGGRSRVIGISKTLSEILVCPISKQSLRYCQESNSLISHTIGVSFPIVDGIPCLVPMDAKNITEVGDSSSTKKLEN